MKYNVINHHMYINLEIKKLFLIFLYVYNLIYASEKKYLKIFKLIRHVWIKEHIPEIRTNKTQFFYHFSSNLFL